MPVASLLLSPISVQAALNAQGNHDAISLSEKSFKRSLLPVEALERLRFARMYESSPKRPLEILGANTAVTPEQKLELVKLPVHLKVYPDAPTFARFTRNPNVFVVADEQNPFEIRAGNFVLMNNRKVVLPRNTEVLGSQIVMNGKRVRFDEAPGTAQSQTVYNLPHTMAKKQRDASTTEPPITPTRFGRILNAPYRAAA